MTDIKEQATVLWTELLEALRADGMIAHCITQSGPATTHVVVALAQRMLPQQQPWIGPHIKPQPGKQVVAKLVTGKLLMLAWNNEADAHGECWWNDTEGRCYPDQSILAYTFVNTDGAP